MAIHLHHFSLIPFSYRTTLRSSIWNLYVHVFIYLIMARPPEAAVRIVHELGIDRVETWDRRSPGRHVWRKAVKYERRTRPSGLVQAIPFIHSVPSRRVAPVPLHHPKNRTPSSGTEAVNDWTKRWESARPCKNNDLTYKSDQHEMPGNTSVPPCPPPPLAPPLGPPRILRTSVNLGENGEIRRLGAICFYRKSWVGITPLRALPQGIYAKMLKFPFAPR